MSKNSKKPMLISTVMLNDEPLTQVCPFCRLEVPLKSFMDKNNRKTKNDKIIVRSFRRQLCATCRKKGIRVSDIEKKQIPGNNEKQKSKNQKVAREETPSKLAKTPESRKKKRDHPTPKEIEGVSDEEGTGFSFLDDTEQRMSLPEPKKKKKKTETIMNNTDLKPPTRGRQPKPIEGFDIAPKKGSHSQVKCIACAQVFDRRFVSTHKCEK